CRRSARCPKQTKQQTNEGVSSSVRQRGQFLDSFDRDRKAVDAGAEVDRFAMQIDRFLNAHNWGTFGAR
ncbi:hypothetical protein NKH69_34695, partial [Mesorhizobium sp. M0976]|uniref:hypothetical protein n=1 Tax=Mesorhizobium sp. M0976 TaxID=2957038 RepID=UPI0033398383